MKSYAIHPLRSHLSAIAPLPGLLLLGLAISPAGAATSITNSLTGFTGTSQTNYTATPSNQPVTLAGSGLNVSFVWTGGDGAWEKIGFSGAGANFGSFQGGDNGRNYLRTDEFDYATISFDAYVTVNRPTRESVFFGIGTGALGQFKQPDVNTGNAAVYLELQGGFDNASRRVVGGTSGTPTNSEAGYDAMNSLTGSMRLHMKYDAAAQTVVYAIDYTPSAVFGSDQTFAPVNLSSIAPEWAAGENSSIFFGGEDGMTFTDLQITVVPEPSSALLLLAAGALAFRRRQG